MTDRVVRPAGGRPQQRRHDQRPDLDDQHRRVHVERGGRAAARHHLPRRARAAAVADDHDARAHGALRRHGPVLQLVRPPHGREAHRLAAAARAGVPPDPVVGRQRLARGRPEDRGRLGVRAGSPRRARALYDAMDFGFYYRPDKNRVLFHYRPDDPAASPCCYDTVVSESRIVDYIGIARGQLPQKEYYGRWRTFPDTCDYAFQETKPIGSWRRYFGVDVFEGAYPYNGTRLVPSWGGSMFEALMPALFVPEESWAPRSWGENHPLTVGRADLPRDDRGGLRLLGLLAREQARGRLRRLGRRRRRHGPERHALERGQHARRPRVRGLPRPSREAGPAAVRVHERRRHAARRVPRAALRADARRREPARGSRATSPACTGAGASATA